MRLSTCAGCGVVLPEFVGPTHRYMTSSAACWDRFGQVLAADYSDPERMAFHQVVVDAYAAQHPGDGSRVAAQSVGLHLMTLCLFLEHGADPVHGTALHQKMIGRPDYRALTPVGAAALTVADMPVDGPVEVARRAAYDWGSAVWQLYAADHDTVRGWLRDCALL
jgi:hypothetical protein